MTEKVGTTHRRLSFVEDQSNASDTDRKRNVSMLPTGFERRQSIWNQLSQVPRKSIAVRRLSYSYGSRKSSQDGALYPRIKLQNTYRLEPEDSSKFQPYKIEPKIYAVLEDTLKDRKYDASRSAILVKDLSQDILRETRNVMSLSPRYKLLAHVVLTQNEGQDIRYGSRSLWDPNLDNSATAYYKNSSLIAVATVYAVYFE